MSKIHSTTLDQIHISEDRQRREFDTADDSLVDLANSLIKNGLIHPITLRRDEDERLVLVAGERRIRALQYLWHMGLGVKCAGDTYPVDHIPFLFWGDLDPLEAYEMELEENIRRKSLTWQERAEATAKLFELKKNGALSRGETPPSLEHFSKETSESGIIQNDRNTIRQDVILAAHMDKKEVREAKSPKEALKVLQKIEAQERARALAVQVGENFSSKAHTLILGSCLEHLPKIPDGYFDVICTDPPYGMGADSFSDGGGAQEGGAHDYDDSYDSWRPLMESWFSEASRVAKPEAHLYMFCDIARLDDLSAFAMFYGWEVHRTPLIWINERANRIPWPENGPMRKYQCIFYAVRGWKKTQKIAPDVLVYPSDENLGHPAQKPVDLWRDLLSRSILPGDRVLDGFAGTGSLLPAAHALKCAVHAYELQEKYYGLAVKRLQELP